MTCLHLKRIRERSLSDLNITDNIRANRFLLLEYLRTSIGVDLGPNLEYFDSDTYELTYFGETYVLRIRDTDETAELAWPRYYASEVVKFRDLDFVFEENADHRVVVQQSNKSLSRVNCLFSSIMDKFFGKLLGPAAFNGPPYSNLRQLMSEQDNNM